MAQSAEGAALTERHRRTQLALRTLVLQDVRRLWSAFDPEDLDRTWPPVSSALSGVVRVRSEQSAALTARYYADFRNVEGISGSFTPRMAASPAAEKVANSLGWAGPYNTRRLISAGRSDVADQVFVHVTGSVSRLSLDRGRSTLIESVQSDKQALGYVRVSDGAPCAFCAMLLGRGPVYSEAAAEFKTHDHCGCGAEPAFSRDEAWPGRAREFHDLWTSTTKGLSGKEARNAFRRAYEAQK